MKHFLTSKWRLKAARIASQLGPRQGRASLRAVASRTNDRHSNGGRMRLRTILFCAALGFGLVPGSSRASIIFTLGNHPQPGEENVLLNTGSTGTTVFGETNQTHLPVQFTSTQTLTEPSKGQARIEATN